VLSGIIYSGARIRTQTKRTKISGATVTLPRRADRGNRTPDRLFTKQLLYH